MTINKKVGTELSFCNMYTLEDIREILEIDRTYKAEYTSLAAVMEGNIIDSVIYNFEKYLAERREYQKKLLKWKNIFEERLIEYSALLNNFEKRKHIKSENMKEEYA